MIVTFTPNPGVDRTVSVAALRVGEVNRATSVRLDPGGKGINVSRALVANGTDTLAVFPSGGVEGARMETLLEAAGVPYEAVAVAGELRVNLALVDPDGTTTKVNEPGPPISPADGERLLGAVTRAAGPGDWVVGCGSLSPGTEPGILADLVVSGRRRGARVAVDSSGAAMAAALAVRPDLVKPNHEELREIAGHDLPTLGDVIDAARGIVDGGVAMVLVSLGADGAVLVSADHLSHALAAPVTPVSTVGAGDCLLAGFLHALDHGADPEDALVTAVAWGAAAVALPGSAVPLPEQIANVVVTHHREPDRSRPVA
jgi:1-phosphofructokinase/6-phosphofructokinase 2